MFIKQIMKEIENILYEELNAQRRSIDFWKRQIVAKYDVDSKKLSNADNINFILEIYLVEYKLVDDPEALRVFLQKNIRVGYKKASITIKLYTSEPKSKSIFGASYYYNEATEETIDTVLMKVRKLLQLINDKLSNPKIRYFYHKNGLSDIYPNIINTDIVKKYHTIEKNNIISSISYIQTRLQFLTLKIVQLVRKYIKEEYKNKIYLEKGDEEQIKILDIGNITINLNLSYRVKRDPIIMVEIRNRRLS